MTAGNQRWRSVRRAPRALTVLAVVFAFCTACGSNSSRTDNSRPVSPAIGANDRKVARSDFQNQWPFTIDQGILACVEASSVIFTASGTTYALNDRARGRLAERSWREAEEITKTTQLTDVPSVKRLEAPKRREIFKAYMECENANPSPLASDRCKRGLLSAHNVSAQELSTISTEGLSHSWPPLKPVFVSLQPLIRAGLALCGK